MGTSIYSKLNRYFELKKEYGAVFLRLIIGWRLVDGAQDNVFSWQRMLEFRDFLEQHHFGYPLGSAIVSVYAQFLCGLLYMAGLFVRPAAIIMIVNFSVALLVVHLGTTFQQSFEALMMLFGSIFFLFYGAGKVSVDSMMTTSKTRNG